MLKKVYVIVGIITLSGLIAFSILGGKTKSMSEDDVRSKFNKYYKEWQEYLERPEVKISSNTYDHINCKAYEEIINLGKPALPYIMEEVKKGQFFFNEAISRIIKVDPLPKDHPPVGEQEMSRIWLKWWEKNKDAWMK